MIQTNNVDVSLKEAEFYEKNFEFSYSSLNTLMNAPRAFYTEYILDQKSDEFKKYLLEGTLIHFLVLENQKFDDKFLVLSENLPSETIIDVVKYIYKEHYLKREDNTLTLIDFKQEILNYLIEINKYQSLKDTKDGKGDDKRIKKVIDTKAEEYFSFLKKQEDKTIIDSALLDLCTERANIIKKDPQMRNLLGMDKISDGRTFGVYNELPLSISKEKTNLPFGFKGILDNLVIDVRQKLIRINDFKTTGKSLTNFTDSVDFWNYWLQAAIYYTLVKDFLINIITKEWKIEFRFIVFDKYNQLYPFLVTTETMEEWLESFEQVKKEAVYHYESKDFSLPYDFAQGNVKL